MGKYNSSTYRVKPFVENVENDLNKINKFLSWFNIKVNSLPTCYLYGDNEKLLKPSKKHLLKIIEYFSKTKGLTVPTMNEDRKAFLLGSSEERKHKKEEAIRFIEGNYDKITSRSAEWCIFEGYTHPDLFIEADDYVLIGEGKWTESHITTSTTNLPKRNQMIRHIQAAINCFKKKIYAFYLVDKESGYLNDLTIDAFKSQLKEETIELDEIEQIQMANCFVGYITWQDINLLFPEITFLSKKEIDALK